WTRGVSGVQTLDLVGEVLVDHAPAQLQGRRDLALLQREVAREDREALDLLHPGTIAVHLVDELLHELLRVSPAGGNRVLVERDQGGDVRASVADDERLRDETRRLERVLEVLRGDVLAAGGDDQVLLAVGDPEEAVRVDLADVARAEPAVLGERRGGRLRILVVPGEDGVAADEDLAVLGEPDLAALDGAADGSDAEVVRIAGGRRARRLGETVALDHGRPQRVEELEHLRRERRRARDAEPQPATQALAHLREDESV